jgi:serine/threonine protein kinase
MSPHLPAGTEPQTIDEIEPLVEQFLAQLRAGESPDCEALVRAHPHLADRLAPRLALVEMIHRVGLAPVEEWPNTSVNDAWSAPGLHAQLTRPEDATDVEGPARQRPPANPLDYEILGELGHGGMGVVFKARHKRLNRLVALKMIRAGAHASPDLLARFRIEGETLAKLQHPNIVQVYEVDEHIGCPYIAMEFVDGGNLRDLLAGQSAPPRPAAELMETLARAMHAAHVRGIVHRDLKPANILIQKSDHSTSPSESSPIEGFGFDVSAFTPKVTDFGLAKQLAEDKGHTVTGDVMGTPSYMAPEQASGRVRDIGPPTDVYSLGAILYELLTGRPPFQSENGMDTLRQVLTAEPPAPVRLRPKLPRDLETICLKCLEKEPAKRYQTAEHLADDLRRFLNREPITARPAGMGERVWKWMRRRPTLAALICVSLLALVSLPAMGVWSYARVVGERDRARASLQVARRAINDLYIKMSSERQFDEPKLEPYYDELLEKARNLYEELGQEHSDDPEVRRDIAKAWFHLAEIHRLHDYHDQAEQAYGEAIARQEELHRLDPRNAGVRQDLATSHNWLGDLFREGGRSLDKAESHFRAAQDLQEQLVRDDAHEPSYRTELARSHYNLGIVERDTNRRSEARADYDRAIELLTQLRQEDDKSPAHRQDLGRALINRGSLLRKSNRPEDAQHDFDLAVELLVGLRQQFPTRASYKFELAIAFQDRANLLWSLGQNMRAQSQQKEALAILKDLVTDYSSRPRYKKKMGNSLKNLGVFLATTGDFKNAEESLNQAQNLFKSLVEQFPEASDYPALLSMTLANLGWLRTEQKNWPEARPFIEQGIDSMKTALKQNPQQPDYRQELRNQYQDLAWTLVQLGDHVAAAETAQNLADVFPDHAQDSYYAACFLARCVPLTKEEQQADQYVKQSVRLLQSAVGHASPQLKRILDEKQVFQSLQAHADFNGVLSELDAKTK